MMIQRAIRNVRFEFQFFTIAIVKEDGGGTREASVRSAKLACELVLFSRSAIGNEAIIPQQRDKRDEKKDYGARARVRERGIDGDGRGGRKKASISSYDLS